MKYYRKTVSFFLAVLALAAAVSTASCGGDSQTTVDTASTSPVTTEAVTEEPGPKLELPDTDFGGKNVNVLIPSEYADHYIAELETGDVVGDAVYNRNRMVEELLNVKYNYISEKGGWDDRETFKGIIRNSVLAADGAHDLIYGYQVCVIPMTLEGVFMDINEVPNIDLEKPWWVQNLTDTISIGGKLYTAIGDASISLYSAISVLYFNKKLVADYGLPDPYSMVLDGTWTLDAFYDLIKDAYSDLNGDGKLTFGDDAFGYTVPGVPQRSFQTATEFKVFDYDEKGMPYFVELSEKDVDLYVKMADILDSPSVNFEGQSVSTNAEYLAPFVSDKILIANGAISYINDLRDMETDFGILPLPKRDEAQEAYHSQVGTASAMCFVPKTAPDVSMTGMVAEAMNYYSYKEVIPAYFEIALKEKYTRDETVKKMLDIIREGAEVNFTFAFSTMFTPFPNTIMPLSKNASRDIASAYAKYTNSWKKTLDNLLEAYSDAEG